MGFRVLVSLHPAIQATGRLTLAPAGLPPAEHTSLHWTHNRTCSFPASGFPTGFIIKHTAAPPPAGGDGTALEELMRAVRPKGGEPVKFRLPADDTMKATAASWAARAAGTEAPL